MTTKAAALALRRRCWQPACRAPVPDAKATWWDGTGWLCQRCLLAAVAACIERPLPAWQQRRRPRWLRPEATTGGRER